MKIQQNILLIIGLISSIKSFENISHFRFNKFDVLLKNDMNSNDLFSGKKLYIQPKFTLFCLSMG